MYQAQKQVAAFHKKFVFLINCRLISEISFLWTIFATHCWMMSSRLEAELDGRNEDPRFVRAHLLLEELGELLHGMSIGDDIECLDAITDLLYVTIGTAVTYGYPVYEAFNRVHASNMTKIRKEDDTGRLRDKGEEYQKPELAELLKPPWRST